jgi:hypothetical protein
MFSIDFLLLNHLVHDLWIDQQLKNGTSKPLRGLVGALDDVGYDLL